jgi:hypothetical protein
VKRSSANSDNQRSDAYGGAPHNPPWYNLLVNPLVTVEVGVEKLKARAAETSGAERQRLFDAQARMMPFFDSCQKKTRIN